MHGVGSRSCNPVAHGARFVNAFLKNLTIFALFIEHQLVMIFRNVVLAFLVPDANGAEHAFHTEGARFIRNDRDDITAYCLIFKHHVHDADNGHGG